jgi:hypothetical protein
MGVLEQALVLRCGPLRFAFFRFQARELSEKAAFARDRRTPRVSRR